LNFSAFFSAFRRLGVLFLLLTLTALTGCGSNPIDPLEPLNRTIYGFNSGLDKFVLKPAADGYVKFVPLFIRQGIGNGFDNLEYFDVVLNDFLQNKQDQGWRDFARMAVNSTVGIGGIFDPATKWNLPAHENSFGNTLAKWGAKAGPYLVLPLFGPSSERDATGLGTKLITNPFFWLSPPWSVTIPLAATGFVDTRSRSDFLIKFRDKTAIDPYVFTREAYLRYRENVIHGGNAPADEGLYDDDTQPATMPNTAPAR
jgi:phospholipid-binding lipoprotein MlaA